MSEEIKKLVEKIAALQKAAVNQTLLYWAPVAERIIRTRSRDIDEIEHTLDALCNVAFDDEALDVFKKLCRYYFEIDPQATAEHIMIYRDLWGDNGEIEDKKNRENNQFLFKNNQ